MYLCYGWLQSSEIEGFVPAAVRNGGVWLSCARDVDEAVDGPCLEALRRSKKEHHHAQIPKLHSEKMYLRFFFTKGRELDDVEMDESTI